MLTSEMFSEIISVRVLVLFCLLMVPNSSSFPAKVLGERGRRGIKSFENLSVKFPLFGEKPTMRPIKRKIWMMFISFGEHWTF